MTTLRVTNTTGAPVTISDVGVLIPASTFADFTDPSLIRDLAVSRDLRTLVVATTLTLSDSVNALSLDDLEAYFTFGGRSPAQGSIPISTPQGMKVANDNKFVFTSPDVLTNSASDNALIQWLPGLGSSVSQAQAQVKTAPTGADILIDLRIGVRATGVLAAAFATVTIPAGSFSADLSFASTLVDNAHFLAAEITQVGLTVAGSNLSLEVF